MGHVMLNKALLISDMREVPKVNSTIFNRKLLKRPAVMSLLCKNELNVTMDNPQTIPKTVMIRSWNMSQRLPGKWMKSLINSYDSRRYSPGLYESINN